jgi:hypothetical protein
LVWAAIIVGLNLVICCILFVRAFQSPVPSQKFVALKVGMTTNEVRQLLGEPTMARPSRNFAFGGTNYLVGPEWTYTRLLTFGYVNVSFTTNGIVDEFHREEF